MQLWNSHRYYSESDHQHPLTNTRNNPASLSCGTLTYNRYAALSHLPSLLIKESSIPTAAAVAAVAAAPILKLCPEYCVMSTPDGCKASLI